MCNLYSQTKSQGAMRHVFEGMVEHGEDFEDLTGNLPPMAGIFPIAQRRSSGMGRTAAGS